VEQTPAKTVRFRVCDLIHPPPARVLLEMFQNYCIEGEVAAVTTDGEASFFVVRVSGVTDPVIVPLDKTQPVETTPIESAAKG
jgi:hypothetical protein